MTSHTSAIPGFRISNVCNLTFRIFSSHSDERVRFSRSGTGGNDDDKHKQGNETMISITAITFL